MQHEKVVGKNYCDQCKCSYFGEYCPICGENANGKKEKAIYNHGRDKSHKNSMNIRVNSKLAIAILVVLIMIFAAITNPTRDEYYEWVANDMISDEFFLDSIMTFVTMRTSTTRSNFVIFSIFTTPEIEPLNNKKVIVLGFMGIYIPLSGSD